MTIAQRLRLIAVSALPGLALLSGLCAQDQPDSRALRGPVAGFVFDRTAGIRPILGIPGAATLGPALLSQNGLEGVTFAPGRDYALAVLSPGRQAVVVRNLSGTVSAAVLEASPRVSRISISSSGDAAVLYYDSPARVEVFAGLPDAHSVSWSQDLDGLSAGLAALAVSDGGGAVLIAAAGEQAPVWLAMPDAGQRLLYTVAGSPSLTFLAGATDVLIADGAASSVILIRDPRGEAQISRIGGAAEGVSNPLAVAAARDNRRILVLNAEPAGVVSLELAGDEPFRLTCSCAPTTLERMARGSVFRLSEPGTGPIWLLNTAGSTPRIVFVPDQTKLLRDTGRAPVPRRTGGDR